MNTQNKDDKLTLGVLDVIGEGGDVSQRRIARRLDVALGLAHSYLKRCTRKGWVKVQQVPGNRYLYFLTPTGFAEKSRLTASYLSRSLVFYRRAGESCDRVYQVCRGKKWQRIICYGVSDLAEIAYLWSMERQIEVVGFVDKSWTGDRFHSKPVWKCIKEADSFDGCIITGLVDAPLLYDQLRSDVIDSMIVVPDLIDWRY